MAKLTVPAVRSDDNSRHGSVGVNIKDYVGNCIQVEIAPGASIEAELFDPGNPVYAGLVAGGRLVIEPGTNANKSE